MNRTRSNGLSPNYRGGVRRIAAGPAMHCWLRIPSERRWKGGQIAFGWGRKCGNGPNTLTRPSRVGTYECYSKAAGVAMVRGRAEGWGCGGGGGGGGGSWGGRGSVMAVCGGGLGGGGWRGGWGPGEVSRGCIIRRAWVDGGAGGEGVGSGVTAELIEGTYVVEESRYSGR